MDVVIADEVNEAVFFGQPPRPSPSEDVFQRFRLADACEWFAKNLFDEVERTKGNLAIRLHPESKVLPKLRVKDGEPLNTPACVMLTVSGQDRVLA